MKSIGIILLTLCLCSCVYPPQIPSFEEKIIKTKQHFPFAVWEKTTIEKGKTLRIYFEGDGNPNPQHQIAKEFASQDSYSNIIYIARPCQWVNQKICKEKPEIYTTARFHIELMKEIEELIRYLIKKHHAPSVELIGYDGGAVIALNLAPKLPTSKIITIAGITDTTVFQQHHELNWDENTQNPRENLTVLELIPQIHYVGKEDTYTPQEMVEQFVSRMRRPKSAAVKVVPDTNHTNWRGIKLDF